MTAAAPAKPKRFRLMRQRGYATACALALVATSGAVAPQPAAAGDLAKKIIIGAGIAAIANEINKNSRKKTQKRSTPRKKSTRTAKRKKAPAGPRATIGTFKTTRSEVRDYQMRLNRLGFDTGTPDGLVGKKTRAGVSAFQASIGAPQTGTLTDDQATRLKALSDARMAGTTPATGTATTPTITSQTGIATPGGAGNGAATPRLPGATTQTAVVANSAIPLLPGAAATLKPEQPSSLSQAGASAVTLDVYSLAQDTSLAEPSPTLTNFSVLDVRPGDTLDAALYTLGTGGATGCQTGGEVTLCSVGGSPTDQIAIRAVPDAAGVPRIATIARHLSFVAPLAETAVTARLQESYGPLVTAPGRVMGTEGCPAEIGSTRMDGASLYDVAVRGEAPVLSQMAANCRSFARLSLSGPAEGTISDIFIVLFDGADLGGQTATNPTPLAKIKF